MSKSLIYWQLGAQINSASYPQWVWTRVVLAHRPRSEDLVQLIKVVECLLAAPWV